MKLKRSGGIESTLLTHLNSLLLLCTHCTNPCIDPPIDVRRPLDITLPVAAILGALIRSGIHEVRVFSQESLPCQRMYDLRHVFLPVWRQSFCNMHEGPSWPSIQATYYNSRGTHVGEGGGGVLPQGGRTGSKLFFPLWNCNVDTD